MYFTASVCLQPCSPASRSSPAIQEPPPWGRGQNSVFHSICVPPAMLAGIPRQSHHSGATSIGERPEWCILQHLRASNHARRHPGQSRHSGTTSTGERPECCISQHLRASNHARRHPAAVPPFRSHLHGGEDRMVYFTASARLQPCSPASRGSPAIQEPPPLGRGQNSVFYSICAHPAMLAGIPRQSRHSGATSE